MKYFLIISLVALITSCNQPKRYDLSETVNPTDTLMCLKADMMPLSGVVFCEFGDLGDFKDGKREGV